MVLREKQIEATTLLEEQVYLHNDVKEVVNEFEAELKKARQVDESLFFALYIRFKELFGDFKDE